MTFFVAREKQRDSLQKYGFLLLLHAFGFRKRIKGSHHIFYRDDVEEILNLQPDGAKAKPY